MEGIENIQEGWIDSTKSSLGPRSKYRPKLGGW